MEHLVLYHCSNKTKQKSKGASKPKGNKQTGSTRSKIISTAERFGERYGGTIGKHAAGALGAVGSYLSGNGDYTVSSNSLFMGTPVPTFSNGKRSVVIRHKEFLQDISGSTAFSLASYNINPGLSTSFPFLSGIASNFEQYKVHGMVFEFLSTSADALNSTNTALGVVISATEYNVNRANFVNKQQMEAYEFAISSKPSQTHIHPIECAPEQTPANLYYVRNGAVPSGEDARLYDLGKFQIATVGMQAAAVIGELWVSYEVEFFKPLLLPSGYSDNSCHLGCASPTSTNLLGPIQRAQSGTLAMTVSATGAGYDTLSFPSNLANGMYMVNAMWWGASTVVAAPTLTLTNCSYNNIVLNGAGASWHNGGMTASSLQWSMIINITAAGAKFQFSSGTIPTSASWVDVFITQMAPTVVV